MGTTAEKLEYLNATKAAIKDAIVAKGVDVPDSTTFRQYAEKVQQISGGPKQAIMSSCLKFENGILSINEAVAPGFDSFTQITLTGYFKDDSGILGGIIMLYNNLEREFVRVYYFESIDDLSSDYIEAQISDNKYVNLIYYLPESIKNSYLSSSGMSLL